MAIFNGIRKLTYAIVVTALLFLSACIDKKYDLSDDNLDKNGVFSPNGLTVPIGRVDAISIYDELKKQFKGDELSFSYDPDGTLFVQYLGNFNAEMPDIKVPDIQPIDLSATVPVQANMPSLLLPAGQTLNIMNSDEVFEVGNPEYSGNGWTITFNSIEYSTCDLLITLTFSGISFLDNNNTTDSLNLLLQLPSEIMLANNGGEYMNNRIVKQISIADFKNNNNKVTLPPVKVAAFSYGATPTLHYEASLSTGNGMNVSTGASVLFDLNLSATNMLPSSFTGKATVNQLVSGNIGNFSSFFNSFENDTLNFYNPAIGVNLETNVGVDLGMELKMTAKNKNGQELIVESPQPPMSIQKPVPVSPSTFKNTSYWLSPHNENVPTDATWENLRLDNLINFRPNSINYDLTLKTNNSDVILFYGKDNMQLKGNYLMKLPFSFTKLNITVSETINDVFSQSIYDNFLKNAKDNDYVEIIADSVDIHLKHPGNLSFQINATILKADGMPLDNAKIDIEPKALQAGGNNRLVIHIEGLKNMGDARNLNLNFSVSGESSNSDTPLSLTNEDYLLINKLKFVFSGGYHFNINN